MDEPGPAFGARRGTQLWQIPERLQVVKAVAMFVRVAQATDRADLGQRSRVLPLPDKPSDPEVSACGCGSTMDNRDLGPAGGAQHLDIRS
ncbi:MAG TPA: hypothetical protein VGF67_33310 [Ktedonobacteraceae bacterium]